jgi:hypothetical protein
MTIPANQIVAVNPGVISSGGSPISMNGVIMSQSAYLPTAGVQSFASPTAVSNFFGSSSTEYALSKKYFSGYDNSTIKPGTLYFASYAAADRAAWLQSGSLSGMTLAELQALSGTLTITIDGVTETSASISFAAATSFTNAATMIDAGFSTLTPVVTWDAVNSTFLISSSTTGDASTITYATGTLSASLLFTAATGALISQGLDEDTPATAMDRVKAATQNWVDFMTIWEPDDDDKTLFSEWVNAQGERYAYIVWDSGAQAIVSGSSTAFGVVADGLEYDGVVVVYDTAEVAAVVLGFQASIDFSRTNGRITNAFKKQSGFTPTVTDEQIAATLLENGYSFYGSYATANDQFNFFYNGHMTGKWLWLDTYINQIYLNSQFQLALMTLLTSVNSIPYNESGYSLIRAAMKDPIDAALNCGIIRTGITLSSSQSAQVNQSAGKDVTKTIEQQGFYLQVLDPGAQVRGNRGTPVINFWYTDGGAVQQITVSSIDII